MPVAPSSASIEEIESINDEDDVIAKLFHDFDDKEDHGDDKEDRDIGRVTDDAAYQAFLRLQTCRALWPGMNPSKPWERWNRNSFCNS